MLQYRVLAVIRFVLCILLQPFLKEGHYNHPDNIGYRGWLGIGKMTLAFRKLDGGLQYYW